MCWFGNPTSQSSPPVWSSVCPRWKFRGSPVQIRKIVNSDSISAACWPTVGSQDYFVRPGSETGTRPARIRSPRLVPRSRSSKSLNPNAVPRRYCAVSLVESPCSGNQGWHTTDVSFDARDRRRATNRHQHDLSHGGIRACVSSFQRKVTVSDRGGHPRYTEHWERISSPSSTASPMLESLGDSDDEDTLIRILER
jgi:hypothetical protein